MPRVVGESYTHAATGLRTLGLNAVAKHVADRHGRGYVLRQAPSPGSRLGAGSTVTLTVSDGPPRVNVDESVLLGQRLDQARTTLQSEHLRVAVVEVDAHGSPPGTVVGVNPTGTVTQGSTVTLSVAAGPHKHGKDEGGGGGD
jgi:serine/threonine-protein kinase